VTKVSIYLSSYNHAKYLREAIDSVLNQTFSDYQLFIEDDTSTDESWFIIQSYTDPRIRSFRNSKNRNDLEGMRKVIFQMATGEYIAIHHSDDIWEPEKLQKQVDFLDAHPQFGAVFTNAKIIDEDGKRLKDKSHFYYKIFDQPNRDRFEWLNFFFYQGNALCHPSVLIRKSCYNECGFYRDGLNQLGDFDMWVRLCLKYEIHVIPEKLVRFRVRSNEMNTSGNRPETRIRWQFEMLQVLENFQKIPTYQELVKIFPAAQKYYRQDGCDIRYVLSMLALETTNDNPIFSLFGLKLLFEAINDPDRARRIDELYGFNQKDFIALTAKYDVFSSELKPDLYSQLAEKEQAIQSLSTQLAEREQQAVLLQAQLAEREQQMATLQVQLAEREQHEAALQTFLTEREQQVVELRGQLVEREHSAQALQTQLIAQKQRFQSVQVKATERGQQVKGLTAQLAEQKQQVSAISIQKTSVQQELTGLKDHINQREQILQDLNSKLLEIYSSTAWKIILLMWKVRLWFAPKGSQRERTVKGVLSLFRKKKPTQNSSGSMSQYSIDPSIEGQNLVNQITNSPPIQTNESVEYKKLYEQLITVAQNEKDLEYLDLSEIDLSQEEQTVKLDVFSKQVVNAFSKKLIDNPVISIVIPVYNHLEDTSRCLLAIEMANEKTKYEVIIADDASTDGTNSLFSKCKGLRYVRNEQNLGFLKNCNRAAAIARGKYIMFLNNDVIVMPHWLDSIIETFLNFPDTGLVGSKLLYPDGTLQEAGGIIWNDGTGQNYGRKDDPQKPEYNYMREVDYCSGASIVISRSLWEQLGGFDELFAPAYYEDTDLAFRVRQAGYKVLYQPVSQVFHHEGTTSGKDLNNGVKHYQEINRHKFVYRWESVIKSYGIGDQTNESLYQDRTRKRSALYIDACTPTPDQDSGSVDAVNIMKMLRSLGFKVSFIPDNLVYFGGYTEGLQKVGIACQYLPFIQSVEDYLIIEGKRLDLVFLSRVYIAAKHIDLVRKYAPQARIVFNTVDLHFLRAERIAEQSGLKEDIDRAKAIREQEISAMQKADQTILVSEYEYKVIQDSSPDVKKTVIPIPREIPGRSNGFEGRKDILFLGGYNHLPNVDAVLFFVDKIWPLVKNHIPYCKFLIAGSNMPENIKNLHKDNIVVLGHVSDLNEVFSNCKISVAPLRYGSGVKGKVVTSLGFGVPCVATPIATEGMGLIDGTHILVADSPEEFSNAVVRVYTSPQLWEELSENGLALVEERYSFDHVQSRLQRLLSDLGLG
jgi:GT2 family glycosyltransferase